MLLTFACLPLVVQLAAATCEPTLAHAPPAYDANHPVLRNAFAHIKALLTIAVEAPEHAKSSFSVEVTSSKETLWSYHHTARERNASRPDIPRVDGDALYRIASITKAFTVLGILQQHAAGNLSLDDPVDRYIAGLRGTQKGSIPWKDITLRSLASQLSGIPRDFAQGDLINWQQNVAGLPSPEDVGLPPVSRDGLLTCDEYSSSYEQPCDAADLIRIITARAPIFAPNQQSTYSNVAFELLGLVLANVSGQTYESYIKDAIFTPLNMSKSTLMVPPDSAGVIPHGANYWDVEEGVQNPTGGIFSSSADLSKFLRYVLTHYNGITTSANWLHPASFAKSLHSSYGMPWEIVQTEHALRNSRRTVRFVTKSGGLPGYTSMIVMLPDYDLGITVLLAGPSALYFDLLETVTVETVRAAEQLSILELQDSYAGSFVSPDPHLNSSITLVADHRGLVLERFVSNSTDVFSTPLPDALGRRKAGAWYAQLVPTLLYRDEEAQQGELWRLQFTNLGPGDGSERPVWADSCPSNVDALSYAGLPLNELVFWQGRNGIFESVELTGFRINLTRIIPNAAPLPPTEQQEILEL